MNMFINLKISLPILLFPILTLNVSASEKIDAEQLFKQKCSLCHAIDKKKLGPAVNAMSSDSTVLRKIIVEGKKSMPGYAGKLTDIEINSLVTYMLANQ